MNDIVTIVTPSYNQASFISETIESVLTQEGDFYLDYIIIDGNSNDDSLEIISRYEKLLQTKSLKKKINDLDFYISTRKDRFNRCKGISYRWLSERDDGHGDALNKGFEMSVGDVMGWLNSDDIYIDGALNNAYNVFKQFGQVSWLTGLNTQMNKDGTKIEITYLYRNNYKNIFSFLTNDHEFIQQESTLWKRDLWEKSGGYINTSYKLMVDGELWCRFFLHADLFHLNREIGSYRRHDTNRAHQFMPQVKAEFNKAVQWLEKQVEEGVLEVARNLMGNGPIMPVSHYDLDFLIIDKCPDSDAWIINKVDFYIYSSKRRYLKIQANQIIYNQNIKQKENLLTQKDKVIADKEEKIKQFNQYAVMAEKMANEKGIIVKDFKKSFGQQEKLLEQSLTDINLLIQRLNEKDILLEKRSDELSKLKDDINSNSILPDSKALQIDKLNKELSSLKLSIKDKESQVEKLESIIAAQKNELEMNAALSEKLQKQSSALQIKCQETGEVNIRLMGENEHLNKSINSAKKSESNLNDVIHDQKRQIHELKTFIKGIEQSYTFRIGKAIVKPASIVKKMLNTNR